MRSFLFFGILLGTFSLCARAQSRAEFNQAANKPAPVPATPKPTVKVVEKVVYRGRPAAKTKVVEKVVYRERPVAFQADPAPTSAGPPIPEEVWNDKDKVLKLGNQYRTGGAGPIDYVQALRCYRRGAELGSALSIYNVGLCYAGGWGVAQDYAQALQWYGRAAALGYPDAMNNLGKMYADGQGVSKDYCQAMQQYKRAAEAGSATGMFNLGVYYKGGYCAGTQDKELARQWLQKAVEAGSKAGADSNDKRAAELAAKELQGL